MKNARPFLWILLLSLFVQPIALHAVNGFAKQSGNWNDPDTWMFSGEGRKPSCGDTLHIDAGVAVTLTTQENYNNCTQPLFIYVGGALQFTNGFKLDLPAGSVVTVLPGGVIRKITPGGGNSTLIRICGGVAWAARDGDLFGPAVLVCLSPLPVSLLDWQARPEASAVQLTWTTGSEMNNDHFEIERSGDGEQFTSLSEVPGAGTSAIQHDYSWSDTRPAYGTSYYRLSQVDFDGKRTIYPTLSVRLAGRTGLAVIPNPATGGQIRFVYEGEEQHGSLRVTDLVGRILYSEPSMSLQQGSHSFNPGIPDGLYFLVVVTPYASYTEKVQVSNAP